jgi:tetratricopeptide (TPR) repeat protein
MSEPSTRAETPDLSVYEGLKRQADRAVNAGRLEEGLEHLARAWEWAKANGERGLVDRAYCNLAAVEIELDQAEGVVAALREILVRNQNRDTCRLAAYSIARTYELRKEYKKALFYARIARDHSHALGRGEWVASSHNQMANCLVADSFFKEAIAEYRSALALLGDAPPARTASVEGNLGYCYVVLGRHGEGLPLLFRSLRTLRRTGSPRDVMVAHLDLCFAYLEIGRYRYAHRHGVRALATAEDLGDREALKNSLYLLGETANLLGDEDGAQGYFGELQRHFPGTPFLVDFLLAIDVRKMINLRA